MSDLFDTAIVEKRNVLNELRSNNMSLQELRFFSIYLSKINPWDKSTRAVRFPIDEFQRIMELGKLNIGQLKSNIDGLLTKIVHIPNDNGGFTAFQLFKECEVNKDGNGVWYVQIDAHDKALPLMFDFKERYFTYKLWNALRLKSANQIRMYEILKQYEKIGKRELPINELRELLGIAPNEYERFERFRVRVLDSCQQALKESTDICFTYERGKTGKGGKWLTVIFHISKNTEYIDQLTLDEFIDMQPESEPIDIAPDYELDGQMNIFDEQKSIDYGSDLGNLLGEALDNEFTVEQVRVLQDLVIKVVPSSDALERCNYLVGQVHKMNTHTPANRYRYLCRMIENDIADRQSDD